ncbi:hypothetical protein VTO42DRAFT_3452 [Malbranchea cinnamomea]
MSSTEPERPPHRRGFSFGSGKSSQKSDGSKTKMDFKETAKDKASHRMNTHADPTKAISELQPSAVALEKSNLQSLRSIQHRDRFGNLITDPDLSNPTRHRFERPLETIRSFEAAIEGTYNQRRQSYTRAEESTQGGYSRPNSYYGGGNGSHNRSYNEYYNGRGNQSRPDSYVDAYGGSYHNQYSYNGQSSRGQRYSQRQNGDQWYGYNQQGQSPQYAGYQANDVTGSPSGSGSGNLSADQLGHSTDPSSVNSSIDRLQNRQRPEEQPLGETYGFNGFGGEPQLDHSPYYGQGSQEQAGYANYSGQQGFQQGGAYGNFVPAPPPKDVGTPQAGPTYLQKGKDVPHKEEKRKSFFKRFSRS